jgi:hypothetical protein
MELRGLSIRATARRDPRRITPEGVSFGSIAAVDVLRGNTTRAKRAPAPRQAAPRRVRGVSIGGDLARGEPVATAKTG